MKNELVTVDFHGASLVAVRGDTPAETLVAMKPVVEGMGLAWHGQFERINRHEVLSKGIREMRIPSAGGEQVMVCLPLSRLSFWLATLQPNKIPNPETRSKVIKYQEECADVLFAHFFSKAADSIGVGAETVRRIEGMVKMMAHKVTTTEKQLVTMAAQIVEQNERIAKQNQQINDLIIMGDHRHTVVSMIKVKDLLNEFGALEKGRNRLNQKVGSTLRNAASKGLIQGACQDAHDNKWMFPIEDAREFMRNIGKNWVAAHNAKVTGQGVLDFPDRRKKPKQSELELVR